MTMRRIQLIRFDRVSSLTMRISRPLIYKLLVIQLIFILLNKEKDLSDITNE